MWVQGGQRAINHNSDRRGCLRYKTDRARRPFFSAALMAVLLATNAQAADVSEMQGTVWTSRGFGFRPVSEGSVLAPGDRARTGDGSVVIRYENGCSTKLGPRQMAVVLLAPPRCKESGNTDVVLNEPPLHSMLGVSPQKKISLLPTNSCHFLHGIVQASAGMMAYSVMREAAAMTALPARVR